jgi:hypothetical protein
MDCSSFLRVYWGAQQRHHGITWDPESTNVHFESIEHRWSRGGRDMGVRQASRRSWRSDVQSTHYLAAVLLKDDLQLRWMNQLIVAEKPLVIRSSAEGNVMTSVNAGVRVVILIALISVLAVGVQPQGHQRGSILSVRLSLRKGDCQREVHGIGDAISP